MYDKLLNKNIITAALVSLMTLGVTGTCEAQGVVSLVEDEEKVVSPQDNTNKAIEENNDFNDFGIEIKAEIPESLPEDDEIIPVEGEAMISPEPAVKTVPAEEKVNNKPTKEKIVEDKPITENKTNSQKTAETEASAKVDADEEILNEDPIDNLLNNDEDVLGEETATIEDPLVTGLEKTDVAPKTPSTPNSLPAVGLNPLPEKVIEKEPVKPAELFANRVLSKIDNDLFTQMSDIEKQTTLLTLELRREKLRNEIEAVKAQRNKAEEEKLAAEEEKKRKELERQKELEAQILREQQLLKQKEIELEKVKQRKALVAYMNKMLEEKQIWIKENAELFKKLKEVEKDRDEIAENFKGKLDNLTTLSNSFIQSANSAKSNHDRTIASLTAQNIQLKKRLEAATATPNPFSPNASEDLGADTPVNIAKAYAILDISGKGDDLVAKLINKEGDSFSTRKGTVLQTGHVVEEITPSYIMFNIKGIKQFLYLVDTMEPEKFASDDTTSKPKAAPAPVKKKEKSNVGNVSSAPTLGAGMFVK